jgi:hypothetical protein
LVDAVIDHSTDRSISLFRFYIIIEAEVKYIYG